MVQTMGELGVRSPDAMIINLFKSCNLPLLITVDKDFEFSKLNVSQLEGKAIFILDEQFEHIRNDLSIIM